MRGHLDRDALGYILCDACGKNRKAYTFKASKFAYEFIDAPFCERKLIHLCHICAQKFIILTGGEYPR